MKMFPSPDHREAMSELEEVLRPWTHAGQLDVLEAGGGSLSHVPFGIKPRVTVIDISREQLERNTYADVKVLGDLHRHEFPAASFDLIVCWNVIEHLEDPQRVVDAFARWLRPGGALVIAAPNPRSVMGLITKYTPHAFHVWTLRHIFGFANAGRKGFGPFPTYMHRSMYPDALAGELASHDLSIVHLRPFVSDRLDALRRHQPVLGAMFAGGLTALRTAALGRWHPEHSDFHLVARKPG